MSKKLSKARNEQNKIVVFLRCKTCFMAEKIFTLTDVMPISDKKGKKSRTRRNTLRKDNKILERCRNAWNRFEPARKARERTMKYTFGDQWSDIIEYKGGHITERRYIQKKGNIPLQNNIMISIFNTVAGLYEKQGVEPTCFARTPDSQWLSDMMSVALQANLQDTQDSEIRKALFKDYICGGIAVARESYEERDTIWDSWSDYVNPYYVGFEMGSDPRHQDINLICELHDVSHEDLYFKFAREDYGLTRRVLDNIYEIDHKRDYDIEADQNDVYDLGNVSFDTPANKNCCRVIECWYKRTKPRYQCTDPIAQTADDARFRVEIEDIGNVRQENIKRKKVYDDAGVPVEDRAYITAEYIEDVFWYYTFMSPDGTVLCEGECPYDYKTHPYTVKFYPFVNGEIHPFLGTIIDQQRYINRLVVMHDMAARSAAKGITIIPKGCIPDDMSPQDFADQFTEYEGLVIYETNRINPSVRPEVITSNAVQIGTYELLQLQLQLSKDIVNVSGALQGKTPTAGTSAARYQMEMQNSSVSLFSLLNDMTNLSEQIAEKKVSNIKQFYDDGRLIISADNTKVMIYDRMSARDVKFRISIKESGATASFAQQANDVGMQLLQMGAIDALTFLQGSTLPFKDLYINAIQDRQAQMALEQQAQQMQQTMSPEQQEQANENTRQAQGMLQSA